LENRLGHRRPQGPPVRRISESQTGLAAMEIDRRRGEETTFVTLSFVLSVVRRR